MTDEKCHPEIVEGSGLPDHFVESKKFYYVKNYLGTNLSKIIFWTAFQAKGELVFFGSHSGLDPE